MYFSGQLAIDPSQITKIERVKPTKIFAKFLDAITLGASSEQVEMETFTAVSVLQQLNMSLRSMKVNNVVRMAINDYDFYFDEKGVEDDLEQAMLLMEVKIDPTESAYFEAVYLVLEHEIEDIKYLIEISIARKHKVGEFPITIKVNGVLSEFKAKENENREQLKKRMDGNFKNQDVYNALIGEKESKFNAFIDQLEMAVRKFIRTDDTHKQTSKKMIRPKQPVQNSKDVQTLQHTDPVYYGYYGFGDFMFYSFLWSSMCHNNHIYCNNFTMVDEGGQDVMTVGEEGFNAGDSNTLNDEADFEPPSEGDVDYHGDNEFQDELESANLYDEDSSSSGDDTVDDGWFSDDSGDSGDASSCSSCSSCGGCD